MADINYDDLAKQFGAVNVGTPQKPDNIKDPWSNYSPKNADASRVREMDLGNKRIDGIRQSLVQGDENLRYLDRFGQLNRKVKTGGAWENLTPSWKLLHSDEINEMRKIQQKLAPQEKPPGAGSTSDRDINLYLNALPSVEDVGSVNKNVRESYRKQYEYASGKATFLENYLSEYGHLRGADTAWSKQKDTFLKQQYGPTGTTAKFSNENQAPAPAVNPDIDALVNSYLPK